MIPCLYASMESKFDNNGIGKLADAQSCIVTEKRNGSFELEMVYPADGLERWGLQSFLRNKISAQMIQPVISFYPSWQQWHRMKVILSVKMKRLLMQADLHEVSTISAIIVFSATTVWMANWFPTRTLGL